jgi:hypothetical protein
VSHLRFLNSHSSGFGEKQDLKPLEVFQILIQMLFLNCQPVAEHLILFTGCLTDLVRFGNESLINHIIRCARERLVSHQQEHGLQLE